MAEIASDYRKLDDLRPHPRNYNNHSKPGVIDRMANKIRHTAFTAPVIVNEQGVILGGHLRRLALLKLRSESYPEPKGIEPGWRVPVRVFKGTEAQELAVLAADNPDPADVDFDNEGLASLLSELAEQGELEATGYSAERLDELIGELSAGMEAEEASSGSGLLPDADPDLIPASAPTRCSPGDLWRLGSHVIGCIDATDPEEVKRLCGNVRPTFVFCDPPYGIEIVATNEPVGGGEAYDIPFGGVKNRKGHVGGGERIKASPGLYPIQMREQAARGTDGAPKPFGSKEARGSIGAANMIDVGKYAPVIGDDSTDTAIRAYETASSLFPKAVHIWWGGNYYADSLPASSCWIVWDKENTGNFADAELAWTNQPTAVRIFKHMWNGLMKASERGQKRVHPTQKPVALAEWCFEKYGEPGDVILDLFLGSGMSLIAAEKMGNRSVRGAELSPEYIDIILARWEAATGQTAERLEPALDG